MWPRPLGGVSVCLRRAQVEFPSLEQIWNFNLSARLFVHNNQPTKFNIFFDGISYRTKDGDMHPPQQRIFYIDQQQLRWRMKQNTEIDRDREKEKKKQAETKPIFMFGKQIPMYPVIHVSFLIVSCLSPNHRITDCVQLWCLSRLVRRVFFCQLEMNRSDIFSRSYYLFI